ncbi:MAG: AAA family ATPase [Cyanobacteria bacterium P01_D01_bin.44]
MNAPRPNTNPVLLENHQRLSQSLMWKLQRQHFEQQGLHAWTTGKTVPHYITSNPFIANAFGKVIFGFLRDAGQTSLDPSQPVYIVELGAGSGRFAYHFLKQFLATYARSILRNQPIKYVMTDFASHTLEAWTAHPFLEPLVDQGILDFAQFDVETPAPLTLMHAQETLTPGTLKNPLVVLVNYFFDSIPQDLFSLLDGQLYETLVTLTLPDSTLLQRSPSRAEGDSVSPLVGDGLSGEPAALLKALQISYTDRPCAADYYDQTLLNQLLEYYQTLSLGDTCFSFPWPALACLDHLRQLSGERLLLLSADKGMSHVDQLKGRGRPHFAFHGSFSMLVNYHAIAHYVKTRGGQALVPSHLPRSLQVCAFLFGAEGVDYRNTQQVYQTAIQSTGPDDFFTLKKTIEPLYPTLKIPQILAYLRFSGWDHNIFLGCWPALMGQVAEAPVSLRQGVIDTIAQVWNRYYWIGENQDLPLHLAQVMAQMGEFTEALTYLNSSIQLYGETPANQLYLAMAYLKMGEPEPARSVLEQALTLQPQYTAAQLLYQAMATDDESVVADLETGIAQILTQAKTQATARSFGLKANSTQPLDPLTRCIWGLRHLLERHLEGLPPLPMATLVDTAPVSLVALGRTFGLSAFEGVIVLFCLGLELEPNLQALCAQVQGDPNKPYATLGLALAALPEADWSVLSSQSPLHRWQLIHTESGRLFTETPLKLDRRILCYLLDEPALSTELSALVTPRAFDNTSDVLPPAYEAIVQQLVSAWSDVTSRQGWVLLCLTGPDAQTKASIVATLGEAIDSPVMSMSGAGLPTNPHDLAQLQRAWQREAFLSHSVLLLDTDSVTPGDPGRDAAISLFLETLQTPVVVCCRERKPQVQRPMITVDVPPLSYGEQKDLWRTHLGALADHLDGTIDLLAAHFQLSPAAVQAVCIQAKGMMDKGKGAKNKEQRTKNKEQRTSDGTSPFPTHLWNLCRTQARPNLEDLAQRIEAMATWEDLVLPDRQRVILEDMAAHLSYRAQVYQGWGFAQKGDRGLGISVLFYGESGTGKTMAAEVLAAHCQLDLYRIDLSTVVSKYIGETEKNLRRIFDAAETGGAILLFDEADALFGKRSEVKDSHDRHANIEVSYLLQRMEAYRGLAILTSNLKDSLDKAFLRRLRFMVPFPFPDEEARAEIWRHIFPVQLPTQGLDFEKLGQLKVTGGHIRNIALNSAFLAAQAGQPVTMGLIREAAQREYLKLEKLLTTEEIRGWEN